MRTPVLIQNDDDTTHRAALRNLIATATTELCVICPFIQSSVAGWILSVLGSLSRQIVVRVLTRHPQFEPANDPRALLELSRVAEIRCSPRLHAKIYLADASLALVTSANLSAMALDLGEECGIFLSSGDSGALVERLTSYVKGLWDKSTVIGREVLTVLAEEYRPRLPDGLFSGSVERRTSLISDEEPRMVARAEYRRLAEHDALNVVGKWHSHGARTATPAEVMQFVKNFNRDLKPPSEKKYCDRFTGTVVGIASQHWSHQPTIFAEWCVRFVFDEPRHTFGDFWNGRVDELNPKGAWIWSALLYLRRHGDFQIYNRRFARALQQTGGIGKLPDQPTWSEYLEYCRLCAEFCTARRVPPELADLVLWERS